jgi:di/tripeptidase
MTNQIDLDLLKNILAVPTQSRREMLMLQWLSRYFEDRGYPFYFDPSGNLYVTKGRPARNSYYPCVMAHTDSVHDPIPVQIAEDQGKLIAVDGDLRQCGLGGDDKAGIFICLSLLERLPALKAAFFVSEEIGCVGSRECDPAFFDDVGYAIEFDSPCDSIMSYSCDGTRLFPDQGKFADIMVPLVLAHGVDQWQHHPYTDISIIARKFGFSCLNLPAGYFRMHTREEYVVISAVRNSVALGQKLIQALGHKYYRLDTREGLPFMPVTGLACHDFDPKRKSKILAAGLS